MESMSNTPHYLSKRRVNKLGHETLIDGLLTDGLTNVYKDFHMGNAADICAQEHGSTREKQDYYALKSYAKTAQATKDGKFLKEFHSFKISSKEWRDNFKG